MFLPPISRWVSVLTQVSTFLVLDKIPYRNKKQFSYRIFAKTCKHTDVVPRRFEKYRKRERKR